MKTIQDLIRNRRKPYSPSYNPSPDKTKMVRDLAGMLPLSEQAIAALYDEYESLHSVKEYESRFGESKTLCFSEAFVMFVIIAVVKPLSLVEIGTQYGNSTRRILDVFTHLKQKCRVTCFDIADEVKYFEKQEAQLILKDVTDTFKVDVLDAYKPDLIFLDARPYQLLHNVIMETMVKRPNCIVAVHDCAMGLCNPEMVWQGNEVEITSTTGVWERHVLGKVFGIAHPERSDMDQAEIKTHILRIFDTPNGLAVIIPRTVLQ